jgi:hypothetical protein
MFAKTLEKGQCFAFPDVCKTPSPGGPVPIPYPNIGMGNTGKSSSCAKKVYFSSQKAYNLKSKMPMSNGDEAGTLGGVVSGGFKKDVTFSKGSSAVYIEGSPAIRLTSPTKHNGSNSNVPGLHIAPSQQKVLIMK